MPGFPLAELRIDGLHVAALAGWSPAMIVRDIATEDGKLHLPLAYAVPAGGENPVAPD